MISFFDLEAQQSRIKHQIHENIAKVLVHGQYILGPEVLELEERLCDYTGAKYCVTCANGTDALQIALMALGVGPGDEVITPAFSYIATAEAAALLGAKLIYVDVDPLSFNIDANQIEAKISDRTKAIIPVSLYGQPADFDAINVIAQKYSIPVIEDAAQSFGSEYKNKKSCNLSTIGCTSFFPTKPLGCYGDGGAIFTSDSDLASSIRKIARHGQSKKYHHDRLGVNSRLDTIQAAILLAKLNLLDWEIQQRDSIAKYYSSRTCDIDGLFVPDVNKNIKSSWALYTLRCNKRDDLKNYLFDNGVPSNIYYPLALYKQKSLSCDRVVLHNSELLCSQVLSIPLNPYLTAADQDLIVNLILTFDADF